MMQILRRVLGLGRGDKAPRGVARDKARRSGPKPSRRNAQDADKTNNSAFQDLSPLRQLKSLLSNRELIGLASAASGLLRREPQQADLVRKAAELLARSGRTEDAQQILAQLCELAPGAISARLVTAVLSAGNCSDTLVRIYEHALAGSLPTGTITALIQSLRKEQIGKALDLARRSLDRAPENVRLHIEIADILRSMNDQAGARDHLEKARQLSPQDPAVLRRMGRIENLAGNYAIAESHLRAAVEANPDDLPCRMDLGRCLLQQKRFAEAAELLRATSQLFPESAKLHALLGHVFRWCGAHSQALESLGRALELAPDNASAIIDIAQIREGRGEFEAALDLHRKACAVRGDFTYNATIFCQALLAAGRGREAWAANLSRIENQALRELPGVRMWQGEPLAGKSIMVINEGGTGDQIRDACAYSDLIAAAERVTIACEPRLRSLFERSFPTARFISVKHEHRISEYERMLSKLIDRQSLAELKEHDYCVLSPDLLYYFRGDDDLWGKVDAYLVCAPELVERWRMRVNDIGPSFRVGISWRSGALAYNRECFYTRLIDWGPILTLPGIQFFNMQYDESEEEVRAAETAFSIRIHRWHDLDLKDDFDGVSALLTHLDLVLAPNTTVLELAGALGVPGGYMIRVPIAYDYWRRKDHSGQDRLYPSVRHIRGDQPWNTTSLIVNTGDYIRREMEMRRGKAG